MTNPAGNLGLTAGTSPLHHSLLSKTTSGGETTAPAGVPSFLELLEQGVEKVAALEGNAQRAIEQSLLGGEITQVEALSQLKKAELALKLLLQIRNKLVQAYDEIQQMRF